MGILLELNNIRCSYQQQLVVNDLSLHLLSGDLACLLGPSGCGKTTTLRAIAGFESVQQGTIKLNDVMISCPGYTQVPEKRKIGMVFQDHALFPHQTVLQNVCFGLSHLKSADRREAVQPLLTLMELTDLVKRYPHELSGGQQQRVALARALAPQPDLILLDEPFSSLDVELRERLCAEVRDILKAQNTSALMVTHDQQEAFVMGDRVGVMQDGYILQWDTPYMLYHEPANQFVADFIGQGSFIKGRLNNHDCVETELGIIHGNRAYPWKNGTVVDVLLRPDDIVLDETSPIRLMVHQKAFKGAETLYTLRLPSGHHILSLFPGRHDYLIGAQVNVRLAVDHLVAFKSDT